VDGSVTAPVTPNARVRVGDCKDPHRLSLPHAILRATERSAARDRPALKEQICVTLLPLDSLCVDEKPPATDSGSTPSSPIGPSPHICLFYTPSARVPGSKSSYSQTLRLSGASRRSPRSTHLLPRPIPSRDGSWTARVPSTASSRGGPTPIAPPRGCESCIVVSTARHAARIANSTVARHGTVRRL
jgi:hypothetical protein